MTERKTTERKTTKKARNGKTAGAKGGEARVPSAGRAESALQKDPLRDRLLPLDPEAPVVCMVTGEVQEPEEETAPWKDDGEMLTDAFAWVEARMLRVAAQLAVSARLGVTTEVDEEVRKWEGAAPRVLSIPEVLTRAEAQAKVLHREWKGQASPAEGVGLRQLAEDFLFPYDDHMEAEDRREDAQMRLVTLSRLRLWFLRALQGEVRASRRMLERRHATRATGWVPFLDRVAEETGLSLLERAVLLLALGTVMDGGVQRGASALSARGLSESRGSVRADHAGAFAELDLREQLMLRRALCNEGSLQRFQLLEANSFGCSLFSSAALSMINHEVTDKLMRRLAEACGV